MNNGPNLHPGDYLVELTNDSTGTWIVVTEDASWYLDLDQHFVIEMHRDEPDPERRDPDAPPRFRLDDEVLTVAQIVGCRVHRAFTVELFVGDPPRPRVAINSSVVAIIPAMSR